MKSGIYLIKNMVNGKGYIGSTTDLDGRKITHFQELKGNRHHNYHLQSSYNKHGRDKFEFYVLAYCSSEKLLTKEDFYMKYLKTLNRNYGYNLVTAERHVFSEETREKIRQSKLGTKASEETKKKLREIRKGKKPFLGHSFSQETKNKMSERARGNKNPLGFKHSEEAKQKIRETKARRKQSKNI